MGVIGEKWAADVEKGLLRLPGPVRHTTEPGAGPGERNTDQRSARRLPTDMGVDMPDNCTFGRRFWSAISLPQDSGVFSHERRAVWVSYVGQAPRTGVSYVPGAAGIEGAVPPCTSG